MDIGSLFAPASAHAHRPRGRRVLDHALPPLLAATLAASLALALVPSAAWAQAEASAPAAQSAVEAAKGSADAAVAPDPSAAPPSGAPDQPAAAPEAPEGAEPVPDAPGPDGATVLNASPATSPAADPESLASASSNSGEDPAAASAAEAATCSVRLVVTRTENDAANTLLSTWVDAALEMPAGSTVEQVLDEAAARRLIDGYTHGAPFSGYQDYYVDTLTIAGTVYAGTPDYARFWSFLIDGSFAETGINTTVVRDGMACELRYVDGRAHGGGGEGGVTLAPDAPHPDKGSDLPGAAGNAGAVIEPVKAPSASGDVAEAWKRPLGDLAAEYVNLSEVLLAGGKVYVAASSGTYAAGALGGGRLYVFDQLTGEAVGESPLAAPLDFTCRPVYADGIVVVPLAGGRLQGIAALGLETRWVTEPVGPSSQAVSGLAASGGSVFMATVDAYGQDYRAVGGSLLCVDLLTGALRWKNVDETAGCYWSGIAASGAVLVYGDDAGTLRSVAAKTGEVLSRVELGASVRSSVTLDGSAGTAFLSTVDGRLHRVSVAGDGTLAHEGAASIGATSTSTPTLFDGKLYVGAAQADGTGVIAVVDAATMGLDARITRLDGGGTLPGNVQCTPLVGRDANGNVLAYVTCNAQPGGVYVYRLGDDRAAPLYLPEGAEANWCLKSVTMGPDGTLYYTNDSGTLFALRAKGDGGDTGSYPPGEDSEGEGDEPAAGSGRTDASPAARSFLGGVVPPARAPLATHAGAQAPRSEADNASRQGPARAVSAAGAASAVSPQTDGCDGRAASQGGANPWAVGGLAVGGAGLLAAAAYAALAHRRPAASTRKAKERG